MKKADPSLLLSLLSLTATHATRQDPEILLIGNDTLYLADEPLESMDSTRLERLREPAKKSTAKRLPDRTARTRKHPSSNQASYGADTSRPGSWVPIR